MIAVKSLKHVTSDRNDLSLCGTWKGASKKMVHPVYCMQQGSQRRVGQLPGLAAKCLKILFVLYLPDSRDMHIVADDSDGRGGGKAREELWRHNPQTLRFGVVSRYSRYCYFFTDVTCR